MSEGNGAGAGRGRTRVVHMSTVHMPFDSRIFERECRTLAAAGFDVRLLVPHDREETVDGVHLVPLPRYRSRLGRMTLGQLAIGRLALRQRASLYHFHDPELLGVGALLRLAGRPVVYDAHEDLPRDLLTKEWLPRPLRGLMARCAEAVEAAAARLLSGVVAATPVIARRFPARKVTVVNNFPPLDEISPELGAPYARRDPVVLYTGDLAEIRGASELVETIDLVPERLGARLLLLGRFTSPTLRARLEGHPGWRRVDFRGWAGWDEVQRALGTARVGIILYRPEPNYVTAQPRKLFEYIAAGLPVVASDFPYWRRIVEEPGLGLCVDPRDPAAAAEAVAWLLEHPGEAEEMGLRGHREARERYGWSVEAEELLGLYGRLLAA